MMREADAHEELQTAAARRRRLANLRQFQDDPTTLDDSHRSSEFRRSGGSQRREPRPRAHRPRR